jgi:hypothetical protein
LIDGVGRVKYTVGCVLCLGSWLKINERPGTPTVNIKKQKQMKHFGKNRAYTFIVF